MDIQLGKHDRALRSQPAGHRKKDVCRGEEEEGADLQRRYHAFQNIESACVELDTGCRAAHLELPVVPIVDGGSALQPCLPSRKTEREIQLTSSSSRPCSATCHLLDRDYTSPRERRRVPGPTAECRDRRRSEGFGSGDFLSCDLLFVRSLGVAGRRRVS